MSKYKFKVGDKVRILDGSKFEDYCGGWIDDMKRHIGKIATIKSFYSYCNAQKQKGYCLEEFNYGWDERGLELVKPEKIIIYRNGSEVIAKNTATGKTGVARCNPADEFDFETGAKLAFDRLTAPEPKKPKYYNGKVICIDDRGLANTKGKIYKVLDGRLEFDGGQKSADRFNSVDQINDNFVSKFIELVE